MDPVQLLAALVDVTAPDEWYVTDGASAVGPVGLELLSRGIAAGKVPLDGYVRHVSWTGWRGLSNLTEHDPSFNPKQTFRVLPMARLEAAREVAPRETLDSADVVDDVERDTENRGPANGAQEPPMSEISGETSPFESASDLPEAMLILLATLVDKSRAEAALIHGARDEGAIVVCSHGPRMFEMLGEALPHGDPVLFAARQGLTLFAEPVSGVGGRAIKTRLSRLGIKIEAAFMVPLHVDGRLLAVVEVGRTEPFNARDVAFAEALIETLAQTIAQTSWPREWRGAPPRPGV